MAIASVRIAGIVTTDVAAIAHAKSGNVNQQLPMCLPVSAIARGVLAAALWTQIDDTLFKPYLTYRREVVTDEVNVNFWPELALANGLIPDYRYAFGFLPGERGGIYPATR